MFEELRGCMWRFHWRGSVGWEGIFDKGTRKKIKVES